MSGGFFESMGVGIGGLPARKRWKSWQISSYDRSGGNLDFISIPAGCRSVIGEVEGAGCVSRIWFTIRSRDPEILRKTILRFHWDGEEDPSVETPFGDFFGVGFAEYAHHHSLLQGMTSGGYFSYWPMPFGVGARFEVQNLSDEEISHFYFNIQYHELDGVDDGIRRFHAKWRRENPTTIGENYTILEARGAGHFTGCVLNMQSYDKGSALFLEGDEMIYVDGETFPSIYGTGTEDYFQGAWYFTHGCFSAPFHGLTLFDKVNSRVSAYRLHVPDAIPFEEEIRVTIEHGHDNMLREDYSSVAYWYQEEPHDPGFGHIPEDAGYLAPLRSKAQGYLMTEVVTDPIENVERRKILHEAAVLRLELKQATARGLVPPELEGLTEKGFMSADFEGLRKIVEEVRRRRSG
jgi:hypothetical protein